MAYETKLLIITLREGAHEKNKNKNKTKKDCKKKKKNTEDKQ